MGEEIGGGRRNEERGVEETRVCQGNTHDRVPLSL